MLLPGYAAIANAKLLEGLRTTCIPSTAVFETEPFSATLPDQGQEWPMVAKGARHFAPCCMVSGATASCAFDHALGAQSVIWPLGGARLANNGVPSGRMMSFSGNASTLPAGTPRVEPAPGVVSYVASGRTPWPR